MIDIVRASEATENRPTLFFFADRFSDSSANNRSVSTHDFGYNKRLRESDAAHL